MRECTKSKCSMWSKNAWVLRSHSTCCASHFPAYQVGIVGKHEPSACGTSLHCVRNFGQFHTIVVSFLLSFCRGMLPHRFQSLAPVTPRGEKLTKTTSWLSTNPWKLPLLATLSDLIPWGIGWSSEAVRVHLAALFGHQPRLSALVHPRGYHFRTFLVMFKRLVWVTSLMSTLDL